MVLKGIMKKGKYFDSVSLMIVSKKIKEEDNVIDSSIVMGTKENKAILQNSNLLIDEFKNADDTDLLFVVKAENEKAADEILSKLDEYLKYAKKDSKNDTKMNPKSIDSAVKQLEGANFCLISVAGKYAYNEAIKALENNLNVMLFSDNVSIEDELKLKEIGLKKNLFVLGPDCGTSIINGVPLAFANKVNRGNIGVVAASGTGLQEVTSLISNEGYGISQAIGTGGRDIKKEIGGLMFIKSIKALIDDEDTKVILLVSKPLHEEVLEKVKEEIKNTNKPIVSVFLGADTEKIRSYKIIPATTLEAGAKIACGFSSNNKNSETKVLEEIRLSDEILRDIAHLEISKLNKDQKYLRGLFSGGTYCYESQIIFDNKIEELYSNTPTKNTIKLENSNISQKNSVIDYGEDEFTVGKAHPMIDFSTRNDKIIEEANKDDVAVILLDLVLGYGSNLNPLEDLMPTINKVKEIMRNKNKHISIITSVTGTSKDPQNRDDIIKTLEKEDIIVATSNAAACKIAYLIISNLK